MCAYTLRALISHEWRIVIVPVNDIVVIQHHNMALSITTLSTGHNTANYSSVQAAVLNA